MRICFIGYFLGIGGTIGVVNKGRRVTLKNEDQSREQIMYRPCTKHKIDK